MRRRGFTKRKNPKNSQISAFDAEDFVRYVETVAGTKLPLWQREYFKLFFEIRYGEYKDKKAFYHINAGRAVGKSSCKLVAEHFLNDYVQHTRDESKRHYESK